MANVGCLGGGQVAIQRPGGGNIHGVWRVGSPFTGHNRSEGSEAGWCQMMAPQNPALTESVSLIHLAEESQGRFLNKGVT